MARGVDNAKVGGAVAKNLCHIPPVQRATQVNVGEQHIELLIWAINESNRVL
jgi:hypothetical protein